MQDPLLSPPLPPPLPPPPPPPLHTHTPKKARIRVNAIVRVVKRE